MTLAVAGATRIGEFELDGDLAATPGAALAVVGPNGAGKSTLLRVVAGLHSLRSGSVRLGERVLDDPADGRFVEPQGRRLGVVFQDHRLFPHLRVVDNVAFGPRARGVAVREARTAATTWLTR